MLLNWLKYVLKGLLLLVPAITVPQLQAQQIFITAGQGKVYTSFENRIDALVMMNGLSSTAELKIDTDATVFSTEWYEYYNQRFHTLPIYLSNQSTLQPEDNCGYLVKLTGNRNGQPYTQMVTVFVLDYLKHLPSDLQLVANQTTSCERLSLTLTGTVPEMNYATSNGLIYPVKRYWMLDYETLEWKEQWAGKAISLQVGLDDKQSVEVADAPLKDTYFTLKGDQYATELGLAPISVTSTLYAARRVSCKITTRATVRTEKHESDRPESVTAISGSAPLEIRFKANGNEPVANYYNWTIYEGDRLVLSRTDEEHSYTFLQAGTFIVKVRAENSFCSHTDSLVIKISESAISAPNVFTPNGDEINDEFRVSYKSIVEFQAVIFNRWGTKIYEWTDIQKGWDGTHNGKAVSEGPYFYVIRAKGSDGQVYNLKGDINLLRGKKGL